MIPKAGMTDLEALLATFVGGCDEKDVGLSTECSRIRGSTSIVEHICKRGARSFSHREMLGGMAERSRFACTDAGRLSTSTATNELLHHGEKYQLRQRCKSMPDNLIHAALQNTKSSSTGQVQNMQNAQSLTMPLGGRWYGRYGTACCPAHPNTRAPALSLADGAKGRLLARCFAGCSFAAVLDALKGLGLVEGPGTYIPLSADDLAHIRHAEEAQAAKQEAHAFACWRETLPAHGTLAETYLRCRGITCELPGTLRFHPECWHPTAKRFPALVALVEGGNRMAVHRTYLRADGMGKAGDPAKAMLGATAGGAVCLAKVDGPLIVAEGIETALSLASGLLRAPATIWAALSTSGMRGLHLPPEPGQLTIAADGDAPGREAATVLAERATARGWAVSLLQAPDGCDWNDVLMGKAVAS